MKKNRVIISLVQTIRPSGLRAASVAVALFVALFTALSANVYAGKDCSGSFTVTLPDGRVLGGAQLKTSVVVGSGTAQVRGKFVSFNVNLETFTVSDYTLNSDITGNRPNIIFSKKEPLHGKTLTSNLSVEINSEQMVLQRSGAGIDMKIQAKDCSEGGIFQMEPDQTTTVEHVLGPEFVYCVDTLGRVLIVSNSSPFIGRESPETATLVFPSPQSAIAGTKLSRWLIQGGGRMGMVTGEDAFEPQARPTCSASTPNPNPTPNPSPTATPTPTPGATPSPTPTATPTPSPSPSPSPSPTPANGEIEIEAPLAGAAINGVTPVGRAKFEIEANNREFEVEVRNVNLPAGTVLRVLVDNAQVGTLTIDSQQRGRFKVETNNGQSVPAINSRTRVVVVDQAGATIVAGAFSSTPPNPNPNPNPTPLPTPTPGTNTETRFKAILAGAPINNLTPKGEAEIRLRSDGGRQLKVEVEKVNLPAGTVLNVLVDNVPLGTLRLNTFLEGELERNTNDGEFVPQLSVNSAIVVTNQAGATIASSTFNTPVAMAAITSNDIDDTNFFVEQQYQDFFDREPDDAGLGFWTNQIKSCGTDAACIEGQRVNTSGAFFVSIEFQNTGYLLYRFNKASFGAMPRRSEFLIDMQAIGQGVVVNAVGWEEKLESNKRAVAEAWVNRTAFKNLYDAMSPAQFVDALFANAGVTPTQVERDNLIAGLTSGAETRATVLRRIAENRDFFERERNPAFVLMQYFGYLHRNPDEGPDSDLTGFNFWLHKLNEHSGDFHRADMVKSFISAGEYRGRFQW